MTATRLLSYLRLMRPANIITAWADILLGFAVSGVYLPASVSGWFHLTGGHLGSLGWLVAATTGLYGGGVVLNDVFDLEIDRRERPGRPIPSGQASLRGAMLLGIGLLLLGITSAAMVSPRSALLAFATGLLAVVYDAYGKHSHWWGPLNMGACRGGNLLLGMSLAPIPDYGWGLTLFPILYIAAITLISRGEVGGSSRRPLLLALAVYLLILFGLLAVSIWSAEPWWNGLPFLLLLALLILPALLRALQQPEGPRIGQAVRAGVLALIAMNAALAAGLAGWQAGLFILLLLPLSWLAARYFEVT
jgi:4-hydroxybenzoate polyprenyltransferase